MATVRLNHGIRCEIRTAALAAKFPAESRKSQRETIKEREENLAIRIYTEMVGESTLKKIQESEIEDKVAFRKNFSVRARCHNGYTTYISYDKKDSDFKFYTWQGFDPTSFTWNNNPYQIKNKKLSDVVETFLSDKEDYDKQYTEACNKLTAFLNSFTTIGQLQKNWPEGEVFYRKYIDDSPKRIVPALVVADINKLFALPPKDDNELLPE